ncbi:reticulon-1 isoform X1 [Spea bombifrons]|uniref:reticulon-1 isoform X1 n=1 Tax=Spea bombifrons TaxID=233779 RepID=UPI00234B4962|nr:reticulon-1 isoform X1 [Spea bombifrons]
MAANLEYGSRGLEGERAASGLPVAPVQEDGGSWGSEDRRGITRAQQAGHPPVTMETTSTDYTELFHSPERDRQKLPGADEGAFYTSLTSDENPASRADSAYYTGILKKGSEGAYADMSDEYDGGTHPSQEMPASEGRGLLSSDSGIGMTPAESSDVNKTLVDPTGEDKVDSYKYMDMSRSPEAKPQETGGEEAKPSSGGHGHAEELGIHTKDRYSGKRSEDLPFVAYMEDPDDDVGLYTTRTKDAKMSPVKITLTGAETQEEADLFGTYQDKSEAGLKPSSDVVPTVTVSEPEDDSPESLTPPSTDTDGYTEPSASEKPTKYKISEDELISAMKAKEEKQSFSYGNSEESEASAERQDHKSVPVKPDAPSPGDNEASSADSGDSEIELVSEDHLAGEESMQSAYMTFSHMGGPPPSPASPSIQYSILREEREAELDSELIIESCDGSSASEESPKREHDSPMMKPMGMDIIEEENGSRTESFDASDFDLCRSAERKLNMENLAESAAYLRSSYATDTRGDPPLIKKDEKAQQKKAAEPSVPQSRASAKPSAATSTSVPLLSKEKAMDLLYWRDVKQTSIVFGSVLLMLFSLTQFSVVSVIAYLALAALSATISFRIYKSVLQAVQKTDEGHPFKNFLDVEISLSQEQIQKYTDCLQVYTNSIVKELRRLFLVQDLVDSLKFAVLMWLLTYVGALFNGLTLLIMAVVSMFSLPVVYDKYQAQIDQYLGLVRTNMNMIVAKIQAKIPGAKQKE